MQVLTYPRAQLGRLPGGASLVLDWPAVFEIEGPGAVTCIQGLLTNDVVRPGAGSLIYGALLTPKGMIVVDCWTIRSGDGFVMLADGGSAAALRGLLTRQLPPRLARVTDRTGQWSAAWLIGSGSVDIAAAVLGTLPDPGRAEAIPGGDESGLVARGTERSPFTLMLVGPTTGVESIVDRLHQAGARAGDAADLRAARVLAGVPTLGAEIDASTLPQEAGLDALEGVSYTKGCYVGQETVARVHFRGHPNWLLRGAAISRADAVPGGEVHRDGKVVATLGTVLKFEDGSGLGLASVRREIDIGETLPEADTTVRVLALPLNVGSL